MIGLLNPSQNIDGFCRTHRTHANATTDVQRELFAVVYKDIKISSTRLSFVLVERISFRKKDKKKSMNEIRNMKKDKEVFSYSMYVVSINKT